MSVALLILGLILFIGLVVFHEWGHFLAARRGGVDVEEFGIGFPPKIWSKRMKSGFEFTINALPLGGFVRLKGEHEADKSKGSFGAAPTGTKIKIMLAGIAMNLVAAFALLTLLALIGMPKLLEDQFTVQRDTKITKDIENKDVVLVGTVVDGSPAAKSGLQVDDRILSVAGNKIQSQEMLAAATAANAGQTVAVVIDRQGTVLNLETKLNDDLNSSQGYLGVKSLSGASGVQLRQSTWSAPIVSLGLIKQFSELTYKGLGSSVASLFRGDAKKAGEQVSGPVGVFVILKEGSSLGLRFILMIVAILSLTLALINVLPIPALDGGRLFVMLLFKTLRKPLQKTTEEWIHGAGFVFLMILFVLVTIVDIGRFG